MIAGPFLNGSSTRGQSKFPAMTGRMLGQVGGLSDGDDGGGMQRWHSGESVVVLNITRPSSTPTAKLATMAH